MDDCDPLLFARLSHLLYIHGFGDKLSKDWPLTYSGGEPRDEVRIAPRMFGWLSQFLVR